MVIEESIPTLEEDWLDTNSKQFFPAFKMTDDIVNKRGSEGTKQKRKASISMYVRELCTQAGCWKECQTRVNRGWRRKGNTAKNRMAEPWDDFPDINYSSRIAQRARMTWPTPRCLSLNCLLVPHCEHGRRIPNCFFWNRNLYNGKDTVPGFESYKAT